MEVGWREPTPSDRPCKWKRCVSKATPYLWPVITTLLMTQIIWIGVYQCRDKDNIVRYARYMLGEESLLTRRNDSNSIATFFEADKDFYDPNPKTLRDVTIESLLLLPILGFPLVIAVALYRTCAKSNKAGQQPEWAGTQRVRVRGLHRQETRAVGNGAAGSESGDQFSFIGLIAMVVGFCGSRKIIVDATDLSNVDLPRKLWNAGGPIGAYFCLVFLAFGFDIFPAHVFQYFMVINCVFQSIILLTSLPAQSFWIITTALIFLFGLARCFRACVGRDSDPEQQKPYTAANYYTQTLYGRFYTYKVSIPTADQDHELGQFQAPPARVGEIFYGELILYAILVGQSVASGIFPGLVSACSVLIGVVFSVNSEAKLIGILFGYCGRFVALLVQYAVIHLLKSTV